MIDLHTHSSISDGDLSPDLLIKEAVRQGLSAIALTDHDTIRGLDIAKKASVSEAAAKGKFRFIPGIELNIKWTGGNGVSGLGPGGEFHLLGLGISEPSSAFIAAVEEISRRRTARNREILGKMYELSLTENIEATWNELLTLAGRKSDESGGYSLGRPHFAAYLVRKKFVKNVNQAFSRYLSAGRPLYVPKEGLDFDEAIALINESGGIPVLAHPISLFIAWGRLPDLIKTLKDRGLMGLEAWHPTAKPGSCRRLEALAKSLELYVTEGSDFHGSVRPERRLGCSSKGRKIDNAILEAIPELARF